MDGRIDKVSRDRIRKHALIERIPDSLSPKRVSRIDQLENASSQLLMVQNAQIVQIF